MKPVDLQVLLNQMSEVSRREKKKEEEKVDKKEREKRRAEIKDIKNTEVLNIDKDKVEISLNLKTTDKIKLDKSNDSIYSEDSSKEKDQTAHHLDSNLKANFIDIKQ